MRLRAARRLAVLALALAPIACDQPVPPPVAVREPSIEADDIAVMKGVLDDVRGRRAGGSFLVVDSTLPICAKPIEIAVAQLGGCLEPAVLDSVLKVLPSASRVTAALDFQARNARRLPIRGALGDDVTYISATLTDFVSVKDLIRQHPGGAVVTFSAPSYPAPRVAVMFYHVKDREHAAVRLEQQLDARWVVADRFGGIE